MNNVDSTKMKIITWLRNEGFQFEEIKDAKGRTINYYVGKYFVQNNNWRQGHTDAKAAYKRATGITLLRANQMTLDQKQDYLDWLSKYESRFVIELT